MPPAAPTIPVTTAISRGKRRGTIALHGDDNHRVSLDAALRTVRETGADMNDRYEETSRGGLAVSVVEC